MNSLKLYILSVMKGERETLGARALGRVLFLCSLVYAYALSFVFFLYRFGAISSRRVSAKVISVGNITLGGTGKTPFTIMLAENLRAMGKRPAVLVRGYGEDEKYLLKARLSGVPVIVGRDRYKSAKRAISEFKSDCVILDDGFQHRSLEKDLNIVLIDATAPFGNMRLFPAGVLREPLTRLKEADVIVLTKSDMGSVNKAAIYAELKKIKDGMATVESFYRPVSLKKMSGEIIPMDYIRAKRVAILAAVANPEYFEWMVRNMGAEIAGRFYFSDHHLFVKKDMESIIKKYCRQESNIIITTEKDAIRSKDGRGAGLRDLAASVTNGKKIDFLVLTIETALTMNKEEIFDRLYSLFNN